jgi:hypothetical protein
MVFVSTQPDTVYFHWQVELYLYQFAKHGSHIANRCYALFGYRGTPSVYVKTLASKNPNILLYEDTRDFNIPDFYIPTIRPHLMKKFITDRPDLASAVFVHDSDVFLVKVPRFELMLGDEIVYMSDTLSYIGYNYINDCQGRYKDKYPAMPVDDLLDTMCACVGISSELVKINQQGSGGAQYIVKNTTADYWDEAETLCQSLYSTMVAYDRKWPLSTRIQLWTAEMWAVLWLLWKRGVQTQIHKDLDFSWATFSAAEYHKYNIFHLAGITSDNCKGRFFKGAYVNTNVFKEYLSNKTIFDTLDPTNATYEYVRLLKEYADGYVAPKPRSRFLLDSKEGWSSIYTKDAKTFRGRSLWRSADRSYIIFNSGAGWILTGGQYEEGLSVSTGGYASTKEDEPYDGGWNHPCRITLLD